MRELNGRLGATARPDPSDPSRELLIYEIPVHGDAES
jgi:hypothetical protein